MVAPATRNDIVLAPASPVPIVTPPRERGGRPLGANSHKRKIHELASIATKNEIALMYFTEKKDGNKRLKPGRLLEIIDLVSKRNKLGDDIKITPACIRQRLKKNMVVTARHPGHVSPLINIEPQVIKVITQMARLRQCLTPSQAVQLINSMIEGTDAQKKLIAWKKRNSFGSEGTIGKKYWRSFKKRNEHLICSKKGQKYELDRATWSTYANFHQMYAQVYEMMVEAGVAFEREVPAWMNAAGDIVEEDEAAGCEVTHDLTRPEYCFVMDEVGGNTSQKGDGHKGGELFVCPKGMVPKQKANTKDKNFTLLGVTALNGDPVMCVVIFAGQRENRLWETGIDIFTEMEGDVSDEHWFENNSGKGKRFPGGPSCTYQGKEVPCLTRWSPKGSITSQILVDILATIDQLGVIDRTIAKPFLLLDGHGSRLEIPFLSYIHDVDHLWSVCFGVPYGTALWQVGDSAQQNGAFNMALNECKSLLIKKRQSE